MINESDYIACLCEGTAEEVIINILLDNNLLIFDKSRLIEEKPLRCRKAKDFQNRYLNKSFKYQITVLRVHDSIKERFKISKEYTSKVSEVIEVITAPEIEMLIIINEGCYDSFKKSGLKPSDYCKQQLKMKYVKTQEFVEDYFSDATVLVTALHNYRKMSQSKRGAITIADLLK